MPSLTRLIARGRAVSWLTYLAVAREIVERSHAAWTALTPAERSELQGILRQANWRPTSVPARDRERLRHHVTKAVRAAATGRTD